MSGEVVSRLEAVVARLEHYASSLQSSSGSSSSSSSSAERRKSPKLLDFEDYASKFVEPFIAATGKFPELDKIGTQARAVFKRFAELIDAESSSKKPSDADLVKFLEPVVKVIQDADKNSQDNRNPFYNQYKAWAEATQAFAWPTTGANGRQHVTDTLESSEFYLNKVLTKAKQDGGAKEKDAASFALTLKKMLAELSEYIGSNFRAGLEWNSKGGALSSYVAAGGVVSAAAAVEVSSGAPPPPPGPPPDLASLPPPPSSSFAPSASKATSSEAGMSAVFDSIRGATTSGLKRVTDDMKTHKNPNLRAASTVPDKSASSSSSSSSAATAKPAEKALGPPKTELRKGTWFVENHTGGQIDLTEVQLKESVYISRCSNCSVKVTGKIKSIAVDSCKRVNVEFDQVVSIFECVNSQNCRFECTHLVPSVQIDKSSGISIVLLSREAVAAEPGIVTSNVSELNLVVPGKTNDDDPIEIPLPEQYITKYKNGKLVTVPSDI